MSTVARLHAYHSRIILFCRSVAGTSSRSDKTALQWAAFAQSCVSAGGAKGALDQADFPALAASLANHTPYMISCDAVRIQVGLVR